MIKKLLMILCDCLLNNYFEGKKMNRYDSLKKLYSDIEVLESAGIYKAANVLHKKFVKEAQAQGAFGGIVTQDAKNFMMELDKAYNSGQPTLGVIQKAERAGLPPQELQALKDHAAKIRTQNNNQNPTSGYSTPQDNTGPQGTPYQDYEAEVTKGKEFIRGLGNAANRAQPQATSGDTSNEMQSQNSMPAESPMYQQAINQIAKLLQSKNPMNRTIADKIYTDTIVKFKNEKRRKLFGEQYQRLVSTNFPGTSLNPGK